MHRLAILHFILLTGLAANGQHFERIFLDKEWLSTRLNDPSMVVVHIDNPENYRKGHIPGALFVDNSVYTVTRDGLYFEMPESRDFAAGLKKLGIDGSKLVVISSGWDTFAHAFRFYVTMEYFGLADRARILDGGIRGWTAAGYAVSKDTVSAVEAKKRLVLKRNPGMLVGKDWIKNNLDNQGVCLIDARTEAFYSGREKGNYQRGGHIRGAKNLTWTTLVDENFMLLDPERLREKYGEIIMEGQQPVMYCHVALRASVLYVVGKALGYDVRLYDGSFNEWDGLDAEYPVDVN